MSRAHALIAAAAILGVGALVARAVARAADPYAPAASDPITQQLDDMTNNIRNTFSVWRPPAAYAAAIAAAEDSYAIPRDVLARQLYQESHYRADIISGATTSPVGAQGIAQFMPATAAQFGIDPLDAFASIEAAARYDSQLFARFGSWSAALAAYDWGQGNVARKGLAAAPDETRRYYSQILADVNTANSTNIA